MAKRQKIKTARDVTEIAKALGDLNRMRAIHALAGRELCVCQIIELLGLAPSTVSKHMSILRQAGLAISRKEGRWVHYRLPDEDASPLVQDALTWALNHMQETKQAANDTERLNDILRTDPGELCKRQNAN